MSKLPFMQIYVADYIEGTRSLTPLARGIWMDCLCAMWQAEDRGAISKRLEVYARTFSCSKEEVIQAFSEITENDIADMAVVMTDSLRTQLLESAIPEAVVQDIAQTGVVAAEHAIEFFDAIAVIANDHVKMALTCRRMRREEQMRQKEKQEKGSDNSHRRLESTYSEGKGVAILPERSESPNATASNGLPSGVACNNSAKRSAKKSSQSKVKASVRLDNELLEQIVDCWNSQKTLPRCQRISQARRDKLRKRLMDCWWRENVFDAIDRVGKIPFCTGDNDRGWRANFDWLLKPDSVVKALEGHYDKTKKVQPRVRYESGKF